MWVLSVVIYVTAQPPLTLPPLFALNAPLAIQGASGTRVIEIAVSIKVLVK